MARTFSGKQVVRILSRSFGCFFVSQKGSHVKLRRRINGKNLMTIIPLHRELAQGTLRGVLELVDIDEQEFRKIR